MKELENFSPELAQRERWLVLNKTDLLEGDADMQADIDALLAHGSDHAGIDLRILKIRPVAADEERDRHAPCALAGKHPVGAAFDHRADAASALLGIELHPFDFAHGDFAQGGVVLAREHCDGGAETFGRGDIEDERDSIFAAARHLRCGGHEVRVLLFSAADALSPDAAANLADDFHRHQQQQGPDEVEDQVLETRVQLVEAAAARPRHSLGLTGSAADTTRERD